jgi:DNA topoisomerase I
VVRIDQGSPRSKGAACLLPGQELLQYVNEAGECQGIGSADVNAYLREITKADITAKDFRTWAGTVLAALALREFVTFDSAAMAKRNIRAAIEKVAARLGNTPAICRKCYVHPVLIDSYLDEVSLLEVKSRAESELRDDIAGLTPEEAAVLACLRTAIDKTTRKSVASTARAA